MRKRFSVVAMVVIAMMMVVPAVLAATTMVVTSNDLETETNRFIAAETSDEWFFYNDENDVIDNSLGSFVLGDAPLGLGSAEISVSGSERRNLATYQFRGTVLADITSLAYSTFNPSAGNSGSVNRSGYLNFNVDFNGTDAWQRRLVYVPSQNAPVLPNTWQEWDAIDGGDALWTWSHYAGNGNKWPDGDTNKYRTWNDILDSFEGISIRATDAWLGIRVGEPYVNGYTENIDAFKFGTDAGAKIFDFEPSKNECKNGGWVTSVNPSFKNQGECVSSFASGGKAGGKK